MLTGVESCNYIRKLLLPWLVAQRSRGSHPRLHLAHKPAQLPPMIHPLQGSSPPSCVPKLSLERAWKSSWHTQTVFTTGSPLLPKYFIQISGLKQSQNNFVTKPVEVLLQHSSGRVRQSVTPNTTPMGLSHPTPQPVFSEGLLWQADWRNPNKLPNNKPM